MPNGAFGLSSSGGDNNRGYGAISGVNEGMNVRGGAAMQRWLEEKPHDEHWNPVSWGEEGGAEVVKASKVLSDCCRVHSLKSE